MFTGIIEEIGTVKSAFNVGTGIKFTISASRILDELKIDDSVSISGACQTVVGINNDGFSVDSIKETLERTALRDYSVGRKVNLERAVKVGDRLGGHIVQGHVDCIGQVDRVIMDSFSRNVWLKYPENFIKYTVEHGSVCIDGVSLTISKLDGNYLMISLIPHTLNNTTLNDLKVGSNVNIEFDTLGKYVEKLLHIDNTYTKEKKLMDFMIND